MTQESPTRAILYADHRPRQHDPIQSERTGAHRIPMYASSNHIHESLVAAGQHAPSCCAEYSALQEERIRNLAHNLSHVSSHIEMLEEELVEARQDARVSQNENAILRAESQRLSEWLDGGDGDEHGRECGLEYQEGLPRMQALEDNLRSLHESVQDLSESVRVLMEEAHVGASNEHQPSGYYFEGGWEDVAELWRAGPAIDRVSGSKPENEDGCMDPSHMANWFERSTAPTPEERRLPHGDRDAFRRIETELVVLQLRDRLDRTETQIEHLANRIDMQETVGELLAGVSDNGQQNIGALLRRNHTMQEEEGEEEEPYCTCGEGYEALGSAHGNAALRGGMGGRDEDEEFVYDYGGYTNWDQAGEPAKRENVDRSGTGRDKDEIIQELKWQIERLKAEVGMLMKAAHREEVLQSTDSRSLHHTSTNDDDDSTLAKDIKPTPSGTITVSILDEKEKKDKDVDLRGGRGEEESEVDGSRDDTNTEVHTHIPASPHLLCQRAASRIGTSTVNYIVVYLPPGFIIPESTQPELVLHSAATIYYFPTGTTEDVVQKEAWRQKACRDRHWQSVKLHKIQLKQVFKNAIADMWEKMGLSWDVLMRGDWNFDEKHDEGDMYMVNDNNVFLTSWTREIAGPHIRGGSGDEPIQIPLPVDEEEDSMDEFKCIYENLMDEARVALTMDSPDRRVHAWMTVATAAQTRNCFLERELETFREMNNSLIQDLQWHIDVQVELEERAQAAEADKRAMAGEYQDLGTFLAHLVVNSDVHTVCTYKAEKPSTREDGSGSPDVRVMRGGDEEASKSITSTKQESMTTAAMPSDPPHSCTANTANSFVFYPQRSTIFFPDTPPHIYLFPSKSTLPEILEMIKKGIGREDLRNDPYAARILEIMRIREHMGIHLLEDVSDERITIDVPETHTGSHVDRKTKISAWQVLDADADGLEKLVKKLEIDSSADTSYRDASRKTTSNEGEKHYSQDVGDLVNSLDDPVDTDNNTDWPRSCACQTCSAYGSETYYKMPTSQTPPVVSVRGGDGGPEHWAHNSHSNRKFPLHHPRVPVTANAPPKTQKCCDTITPGFHRILENEENAMPEEPLSMRLGHLMFPPEFVQQRENSIRRFDWQNIRRVSHSKDKSSRDFRYTGSAHCEGWATQLDKHREHCDYCQAAVIEEDYATKDTSPKHEEEASEPTSGAGRPWKKSKWPENSNTSTVTAVENSDLRLRGGAGSEADLEYDSEDWQSEWDDLASRTQSSGRLPRTLRNSSTLSTKTTIPPPSPVDRSFTLHRWPRESNLCTAMEFIRAGPTISEPASLQVDALDVREARSKTSHPLLVETRRSRVKSVLERPYSRYSNFQNRPYLGGSIAESESVLSSRTENWLENPRPAPPLPCQRQYTPSSRYTQQSPDNSLAKAHGSDCSTQFDAKPRESTFRSDRHEPLPISEHSDLSENTLEMRNRKIFTSVPLSDMLSDEMYEEHVTSKPAEEPIPSIPKPRRGTKLCKRCAEVLAMLMQYTTNLGDGLVPNRPKKSASHSAVETPAAPAPSRVGWEARYMNCGLPPLSSDKSLPPTPHTSVSTFNLHLEPKDKFSVALHLEPEQDLRAASWASVAGVVCAHAIAQAQHRAHADSISQEGDGGHMANVAGQSI